METQTWGMECTSILTLTFGTTRTAKLSAFYRPGNSLALISGRSWVDPRATACGHKDYVTWKFPNSPPRNKPGTFRPVQQKCFQIEILVSVTSNSKLCMCNFNFYKGLKMVKVDRNVLPNNKTWQLISLCTYIDGCCVFIFLNMKRLKSLHD
jgi:hypothetical protein